MKNDEDNVEIFEENATDEEDEEDEEMVNPDVSDTDHKDEECVFSRKEIEFLMLSVKQESCEYQFLKFFWYDST